MPAYVVLQFAPARRTSSTRTEAASLKRQFERVLADYDAELLPASDFLPDAADSTSFTTIAVPDMARAQQLADVLREIEGVDSAYAKPGEELP